MNENNYRAILLSLIASLTLCDHMGDVSDDVSKCLHMIGLEITWEEWGELSEALHKMGVKTLYGSEVWCEEDQE